MDDEFKVAGAVAVVTGSTRGIGRQAASALARKGARIVLVGRTSAEAPDPRLPGTLEEVADDLREAGVDVRAVRADLADPDATQRVVDLTLHYFGRCDVLVNNAAFTSNGPIADIPWRRWQAAFRLQVVAPLQLCQGFLPGMFERGSGRVVNISSAASQGLMRSLALYSVSKQAMERWNDHMHFELGGKGVSFNVLRVDRLVRTEGFESVLERQGEEIATGGQGITNIMSAEQAGEHIAWMVAQPSTWSGQIVGFEDITALGGPPTPPRN
jgi:NAD(P)-dependent dehydrogenase (short-subunit alcohol dehydrogenase family)